MEQRALDIIVPQLAPTLLLTATVWMLVGGLGDRELPVRIAAAGILLASGVLGAVSQYAAATEGRAVIDALRAMPSSSTLAGHDGRAGERRASRR